MDSIKKYREIDLIISEVKTDVVFKINGQTVPAIKAILELKSPVFRAMFSNNWMESNVKEIEIKNTTYEAFKCMVELLYTDCRSVNDKDVDLIHEVMKLTERYQLIGLQELIDLRLKIKVTMDILKKMSNIAYDYQLPQLIAKIKTFVAQNCFDIMCQSEEELDQLNDTMSGQLFKVVLMKVIDNCKKGLYRKGIPPRD